MSQPVSGKPSLIDHELPPNGTGHERDTSLRMLDALEPDTPPASRAARAARRGGFGRLASAALLVVAGAAFWSWWHQRTSVDSPVDLAARNAAPAVSAASDASPASAASGAAIATAPVATIITAPEPTPAAAVAAASVPVVVAAASASEGAAPSASAVTPSTRHADAKPAKAQPTPSAHDTRVAAAERKPSPRGDASPKRAVASASGDPDVALLTAVLATMPRGTNANGVPSAQAQVTIAQLVQRCEAHGVKDAIETFECKRRICDGYWGKAEACPMSLSPKNN